MLRDELLNTGSFLPNKEQQQAANAQNT